MQCCIAGQRTACPAQRMCEMSSRATCAQTFYLGLFAGFYLSFGGAFSLKVAGNMPTIAESDPGLQNLFGALFGLPTCAHFLRLRFIHLLAWQLRQYTGR